MEKQKGQALVEGRPSSVPKLNHENCVYLLRPVPSQLLIQLNDVYEGAITLLFLSLAQAVVGRRPVVLSHR